MRICYYNYSMKFLVYKEGGTYHVISSGQMYKMQ